MIKLISEGALCLASFDHESAVYSDYHIYIPWVKLGSSESVIHTLLQIDVFWVNYS